MKKLYRSTTNRRLAGVCAGLAEHFDLDPNVFRLGAILIGLATGIFPAVITYLLAWAMVPRQRGE